ncbi:HET-domain-containing protein [Mollisia scopiformis]|uniref:HET-domain-containing protein n=1 Tax=Mollisia scopiformis TaxID=149040 RepID=A0A194XP81_MOLSC|nr:HET-domain-containing protein [Mollisia scopiformis]KUJ22055.1 HET-domain-containing protein [Mollisia scopiformis]
METLERETLETVVQRAKTWIEKCTADPEHLECQSRAQDFELPTRLIDVGPSDGSKDPKLVTTAALEAKTNDDNSSEAINSLIYPYLALSYCWGDAKNLRTIEGNIEQMKKNIFWHEIPPTIQDAILITRGLGKQYLWVDALCIVQKSQGDAGDFETEAPKMAKVYGGAFLTISAALASDTTYRLVKSQYSDAGGRTSTEGRKLEDEPIYSRAWTLQERMLSPRLLILSSKKLLWECQKQKVYRQATTVDDIYLAGHWKKFLYCDLLWQQQWLLYRHRNVPKVPTEKQLERAPSWSWASLDDNLEFATDVDKDYCHSMIEVEGTYLDTPGDVEHTGEWLRLRGKLVEARLENSALCLQGTVLKYSFFMDFRSETASEATPILDTKNLDVKSYLPDSGLWCLLVAEILSFAHGLVLKREQNNDYKRAGSFFLPYDDEISEIESSTIYLT